MSELTSYELQTLRRTIGLHPTGGGAISGNILSNPPGGYYWNACQSLMEKGLMKLCHKQPNSHVKHFMLTEKGISVARGLLGTGFDAPKIVTNHQITGPELLAMAHGGSVSLDDETILTLHPDAYVNAAFLGQPVLDPRAVQDARLAQARSMISLFLQDEIGRDSLADEFGKVFPQS